MKLLAKTREKLGYWALKRKVLRQKRNFKYHNFKSAKSVLILFEAENQGVINTVKNFSDFLSNLQIKVTLAGFTEKIQAESSNSVVLFSLEKTDFYGLPKNTQYADLANLKPDMLIKLSLRKSLPVDNVFGLSRAEFKIATSENIEFADFTIDVTKNPTVEFLIEQIKIYMEMIEVKR